MEVTKNTVNGNTGQVGGTAIQPPPTSDKATFNGSYNLKPNNAVTLMNGVGAEEDDSDAEDEDEQADHTFEFTTNLNVFRFIRMIITLQVIALMVDKEDMEIPVLFRLFSRGPLFYSIRFYSRPFLDLIYAVQFNQNRVPNLEIASSVAKAKQQSGIGRRLLSYVSSYVPTVEPNPVFKADIVFLPDRNWHTIQYYGHFFLGLFAVIMSFLFTFKFWEMKNYTDRFEMDAWLKRYATRKWWRVGGFNVMFAVGRGSLAAALCVFFLYALCKQFVPKGINTPYQHTLSTHPINTPYQHTLSTHPLNIPYQYTSIHPINPSSRSIFSNHAIDPRTPLNPSSQPSTYFLNPFSLNPERH